MYVFASKAGAPTNPDCYRNLLVNPEVHVELGAESFDAVAEPLKGDPRDQVYARQAELYPAYAEYQEKTGRIIPVVALRRKG
ncbi:MAG: nitroreductase/quinone reductase family protein [Acidimicrobiales bacterium]